MKSVILAGRPHCPTCPTLSYFVLLFNMNLKCPTFGPKIAKNVLLCPTFEVLCPTFEGKWARCDKMARHSTVLEKISPLRGRFHNLWLTHTLFAENFAAATRQRWYFYALCCSLQWSIVHSYNCGYLDKRGLGEKRTSPMPISCQEANKIVNKTFLSIWDLGYHR